MGRGWAEHGMGAGMEAGRRRGGGLRRQGAARLVAALGAHEQRVALGAQLEEL